MNWGRYFYSYNQIIFTVLLLLSLFLSSSYNHRKYFAIKVISSFVIGYFSIILINMINISGIYYLSACIEYFLIIAIVVGILLLSYEVSINMAIFICMISYTLRHMLYLFAQLLTFALNDSIPGFINSVYMNRYLFGFCFYVGFIPIFINLYFVIKQNNDINLGLLKVSLISVLSILVNILFNLFSMIYFQSLGLEVKYFSYFFNIIICLVILLMSFSLLHTEKTHIQMSILKQINYEKTQQYEMSKQNIELINLKCHDLRHQIRALKNDINAINIDELDTIEKQIKIYDSKVKTENQALDTLLREKSTICLNNNIVFDCIIDGKLLSFIPDEEIYTLFGNILDNAIESSLKIDNKNKRIITLKVNKELGGVHILEENTFTGTLKIKNGLPVTDKNPAYHGYGMKSIQNTVNKYDGSLKVSAIEDRFQLQIFFPAM